MLLHMNFITTEFQKKEQDNRSKGQGNKHGLEEQVQLREGDTKIEKKKSKFVLNKVCVKAHIRGLFDTSGNRYTNCITRHANEVDLSPARYLRMGRQDGVEGSRRKEVCVLRIDLMYVSYLMYFYYLLIYVLSLGSCRICFCTSA